MSDHPPLFEMIDPDGNKVTVGGATAAEQVAEIARLTASWGKRQAVRLWLEDTERTWELAKDTLQDVVDGIDKPPMPGDPGWPTLNLALVEQQFSWMYTKMKQQDKVIIGIADVVITMARFLARQLESNVTAP